MAAPSTTIFSFPRPFDLSPNALMAQLHCKALTAGKYSARRSLALPTVDFPVRPERLP